MLVGDGFGTVVGGGGGGGFFFVLVGAIMITAKVFVGTVVCVGITIGVLVFEEMLVTVLVGNGVRVGSKMPGVRNTLIHAGWVRMAGSMGSMRLAGRLVRKSLLGLKFEPILVFSFQLGAKRSAHPLARMMQMNPNNRIRIIMIPDPRLSFSRGCMEMSIDGETHINCRAGVGLFVMTRALQPDVAMVSVYYAT